jgi:hypothetical protein
MSFFVSSPSFWQQSQAWRASQAAFNSQFAGTGGLSAFEGGVAAPTPDNFATTQISSNSSAAVLAAKQALARVNKANADIAGTPTKSVRNVADQVTVSGALAGLVNFGAVGPSASGGFKFASGSALTAAFNSAMVGKKSHGDAIDTVSVSGNTLTASTSGANAHTVFTLSLKPETGMWTFTLVNPIDLPSSKKDQLKDQFTTLNLTGLMQAVKSDGTTMGLSGSVTIEVHNHLGSATEKANAGIVHEGGLAYTGPIAKAAPAKPGPYQPPINPLTGRGYVSPQRVNKIA